MPKIHRTAYVVLTAGIAVAAGAAAVAAGSDPGPIAAGLLIAWSIQAASFWFLAGALESGRPVAVPWMAGIAARIGGLAVLWAFVALTGRGREAVLACAFALVTFLLIEAAWLAVVTHGDMPETGDR